MLLWEMFILLLLDQLCPFLTFLASVVAGVRVIVVTRGGVIAAWCLVVNNSCLMWGPIG